MLENSPNSTVAGDVTTSESITTQTEKEAVKNVYLIIFDKDTGERRTSYVVGVHGDSMDELKALVNAEKVYSDCLQVEDDGTIQRLTSDGTHIYLNGECIKKQPHTPTIEETQEKKIRAHDEKYEPIFADIEGEIMKAELIYQDKERANELREELQSKKALYIKEREALTNGK